jgi:hypothetical protein
MRGGSRSGPMKGSVGGLLPLSPCIALSCCVASAWRRAIAHWPCVGIFQNNHVSGDASSRYFGELFEIGASTKNIIPIAKKDSLTSNQTGVRVIISQSKERTARVTAVRRGARHSWKL